MILKCNFNPQLIQPLFRKRKITQIHNNRLGLESNKMADKHCVEYKLCDMLPKTKRKVYKYRWRDIIDFFEHDNSPETDFIQYFPFLHETKPMKESTLWSTYSRLNSVYQTKTGKRLRQCPRIKKLLKCYNNSYERKTAAVFSIYKCTAYYVISAA